MTPNQKLQMLNDAGKSYVIQFRSQRTIHYADVVSSDAEWVQLRIYQAKTSYSKAAERRLPPEEQVNRWFQWEKLPAGFSILEEGQF